MLQDLQKRYPQTEIFVADLSQAGSAERLFEQIQAKGLRVHRLLNNAGVGLFGDFAHTDLHKELAMIELNVASLVTLTKLFLVEMLAKSQGEIINVSSIASFMSGPKMSVYYATKAFVTSFTEAIAYELRHTGIRVRLLAPGTTATGFEKASQLEDSQLFNRFKTQSAEQVATALLSSSQDVVISGWPNRLAVRLAKFLPRRLVTAVVAKIQEKKT